MDSGVVDRMSRMIREAVRKYERRILVKGVEVGGSDAAEGRIRVVLYYGLRDDDSDGGTTYTFTYEFD